MNQPLTEVLNYRFACREFDVDHPINKDDFMTILEAGRLSPSSFGFEPWVILVVDQPELRAKISPFISGGQSQLQTASHFVVMLARKSVAMQPDSPYPLHIMQDIQKLSEQRIASKQAAFDRFIKVGFDLTDERKFFDWTCKQCYFALSQMILASALLKIDSCVMEGFDRHGLNQILAEEKIIDPNDLGVAVVAAFGYRKPGINSPEKKRRTIDEVVYWQ